MLYGTSIAQGGCVSRPAMAWGTILQRALDLPLVNLGFSGNGRLEPEVLKYICQSDARLYILDCLPNILEYDVAEIERLTYNAVKQIRLKSTEPILLVDHVGYTTFETNPKNHDYVIAANKASRRVYEKLIAEGVKNIGKVCIGTIQGDLHDIGKNLVKMMMEGKGLEVIDLGSDVAPETFVQTAKEQNCQVICCSALLTTTMNVMADVVKAAEAAGIRDQVKIMIGGAPVTDDFCRQIGADAYTSDAASAAEVAVGFCS